MKNRIVGLVAATVLSTSLVGVVEAPSASARTTCSSVRSRSVSDFNEFYHFRGHFKDVWRDTLYYQNCTNGGRHWWYLRGHQYSLTHRGSTNCFLGDFEAYYMNATPLGSSNPPEHKWGCVGGKKRYTYYVRVGKILYQSSRDKCWYATWKRAMNWRPDTRGHTNTACF